MTLRSKQRELTNQFRKQEILAAEEAILEEVGEDLIYNYI